MSRTDQVRCSVKRKLSPLPRLAARSATRKADAVARGCYQTFAARIRIRPHTQRRPPLQPASFCERQFPLSYKPWLSPWREAESMPRVAYPGSRGYCRPRQGDSNAHSFAQLRMLRVRQGHSLNGSTVCSTSPLPRASHCALALSDFHRVSRAVGPNWQGRKSLSSCRNYWRFDSIAKVCECPDHSGCAQSL